MQQYKIVCVVDDVTRQKLLALLVQSGIDLDYIGISKLAEPKKTGWSNGFKRQLWSSKK
jgi:hypothetical protein